ncbi:MAG: YidC/Oxa1 family membrane protein insertase [Anaerolineae bacterium]|nr:YidC/Oxa1 family membrane protein insertase [Anaerolineae bacterium]MCA9887344.1 YidC/Oxa1 family membrane protein insertase [Anaerolineae bacterium]MCA9891979.1 YidC/Oxa1 family membrane protein insertase [Anaerolineae bacterium]MCB9461634.1 YidC/Oxa1 family membrane protein insertase [Anaerolineaceae bacterium]
MWDIFINPVVTLLTWLYALLGNNVVLAIIVLTVVFRLLTYPLFAKQQESTKKMQEIQPELKRIQEKYKDDREKQQQATMELYSKYGVNPFAGCLPLFIQFPIIIALYQAVIFALAATPDQLVDLSERLIVPGLDKLIPLQNIWLGMDLTQPPTPPLNPTYALVLPVLVMATQWLSFRVTMSRSNSNTDDKADDKSKDAGGQAAAMTRSMSTIMPVMFGVFALSFSVGISIYFITSSVVSIVQYWPPFKRVLDRVFRVNTTPPDQIEAKPAKATRSIGNTGGKTSKGKASR